MGENQSPGVPQTPQCKALNRGATIVVVLIPYAWNGPALYVDIYIYIFSKRRFLCSIFTRRLVAAVNQ